MNSPNGTPDAPRHAPAAKTTAPEVAEYLQRFRGKSAEQMLGLPPGNGLWSATALAGGVSLVLLAALTVGPYLMAKAGPARSATPTPGPEVAAPAPTEPTKATPAKTDPVPKGGPGTAPNTKVGIDAAGKTKGGPDILDKLGENQTKTVSPKVNPLDKKDDDLLKDLK